MAAVIMLLRKPTKNKTADQFFKTIDQYMLTQGLSITDDSPRTYFSELNVPPTKIKGLINTIKSTDGFNIAVRTLFFSASLTKG